MSNKKEIKKEWTLNSKWLVVGAVIILLLFSLVLLPSDRILSVKSIFFPINKPTSTVVRIPVTIHPLNDSLSKEEYIDMALSDLAKTLNIEKSSLNVKSAESKDWSNSSLGCPKEGMMYAQVITPGYLIMLESSGSSYIYHAGSNRVVVCSNN